MLRAYMWVSLRPMSNMMFTMFQFVRIIKVGCHVTLEQKSMQKYMLIAVTILFFYSLQISIGCLLTVSKPYIEYYDLKLV